MPSQLLDGKENAARIKRKLHNHVDSLQKKYGLVPCLAVIRVGENPASKLYVTSKCRQSEEMGMQAKEHHLPENTHREEVIELIHRLNANKNVHGILVQLPLPDHLNPLDICEAIDLEKDVDGLHPYNLGRLAQGNPYIIPCTPKGCMMFIKDYYKSLKGLKAVIIGCSNLVGKPLGLLLLNEDCTVTYVHRETKNIEEECVSADILVAAAGSPKLVKKNWVKPGALVIDVGINYLVHPDGTSDVVGDVDFNVVKDVAGAITPVPGGVGPMTVACLLQNTVEVALRQMGLEKEFSKN